MARGKQQTKKKATRATVYQGAPPALIAHVAASVNPFDPSSSGKKIHDANAAQTFTFQARSNFQMVTNANGMAYSEYYPSIKEATTGIDSTTAAFIPVTGIVGGGVGHTNVDATDYTNLTGQVNKYRIVSWGIKITALESAFAVKGRVLIRSLPQTCKISGQNVLGYSDDNHTAALGKDLDLIVIPSHNGESYYQFLEPDSTWNNIDATDDAIIPSFRAVGVTVSGATVSTTVLSIEHVVNIEVIPKLATIGARLSTPAAPQNLHALQAVNNTRSTLPLVHSTPTLASSIRKYAGAALGAAANYATSGLAGVAKGLISNFFAPSPQITSSVRGMRQGRIEYVD